MALPPEAKVIGKFVEWLEERGYRIAEWGDIPGGQCELVHARETLPDMLTAYYGVDR